MTQRFERWLIVGACVVLYVLAMGAFALITDKPMRWAVDWLIVNFGHWGAAAVIGGLPLALLGCAKWRDRHLPPVEFTPPKLPRWVRIVGNTYLVLLGIGLVIAFAAIAIAG
jgi:hypothetical protein